jgi:hypothetical protein
MHCRSTRALAIALTLAASRDAATAQFVVTTGKLPETGGLSENVDVADVDLDGDWDAAVADGGNFPPQVNKIYVNQGGLEGGVEGFFVYDAARFPAVVDQSRDVEFVDFDADGDPDLHVSNTAQVFAQGNRWYANLGNQQGGTLGYYLDETSSRWVGLGGPGSSIALSQVLPDNTFLDWSCDSDFGDLDNDGDLDLIHGSYGGAFGGQVPTRLFLNDGDGHFSEWNPSGFQLPIATIQDGDPGLWCEGTQQKNTTDFTGVECDVASSSLDDDLGDVDGDFDLDLLHGARQEATRMFANRLDGSALAPAAGTPLFRDVTTLSFPPGWTTSFGKYEQEMADLDRDGDLDLLGLNWWAVLVDVTLNNAGTGVFDAETALAGSAADDNEGDFLDYDNDGDLDLYVANFSGQDKLYRNDYAGGGSGAFAFTKMSSSGWTFTSISLDADACDVDGDGDYDVLVAADANQDNTLLENVTQVPDVHAPYLPRVEDAGDLTAAPAGIPVRVQVYDNAPYYITWYNPTVLNVAVDGVRLPPIPARSSAGQIFRAVLPGNLVGAVEYAFASRDEYGNEGTSSLVSLTATAPPAGFQTAYGASTAGLSGGVPVLRSLSVPFAGTTAYLALSSGAAPGTPAVVAVTTASLAPTPVPGLLTLNVSGVALAVLGAELDASGDLVLAGPLPGATPPGVHLFCQGWVLDATAGGAAFASSQGLELVTQ